MTLYLEDLSYQEIAAITGLTENNVGVKLNRIKTKIQQLLKQ
jgi:RNA polymerase sigma-70 factor (ECF subfamily)